MGMISASPQNIDALMQANESRTTFSTHVVRGMRAALATCPDPSTPLSAELSSRYVAILGFALKVPEAWHEVRTLLHAIAAPILLRGSCTDWTEIFNAALQVAEQADEGATAAWLHLEIGRQLVLTECTPEAHGHFEQARHLAQQVDDRMLLFRATERLAYSHIVNDQFDTARTLATGAILLAPPGGVERALLFHTLGYLAAQEADYPTAIERYSVALHLREAAGATLSAAKTLRDIGVAYACYEDYERAKIAFEGALHDFARFDDQYNWAMTLMDLGVVFLELGDPVQSQACLDRAEPIFVATGCRRQLARLYNNRGRTQHALGQHDNAAGSFEISLSWGRLTGATYEVANTLDSLATLYLYRDQFSLAVATWGAAQNELHKLHTPSGYLESRIKQGLQAAAAAA